ncbi:7-carboxy-7-deazaguanine synthase QueE [Agaribacterium haliotis]|uniref:7-carboxy-7-deazaguanine synthase QueE n=1 Tax=Agaribacterium haliotis TaxID=2013869 RepID=UPI000BB59B3A|nr:7-carboxy-7-deazaguanine synthase QueE [Agaribacterium haliotis]
MTERSLRITEMFLSLQGEALAAGLPTSFVRLTGCPLRCHYCDSEYAFHGGERLDFEQIFARLDEFGARQVCVTGGEPLAQPACLTLLSELSKRAYQVSLETSGAMDIAGVDERVSVVMDLKTPDSGELERNRWQNIELLKPSDQLKFVICSERDFAWAELKIRELNLCERVAAVLISPSFNQVDPSQLAQWVIDSGLNLRFQLQLHKLLWGDKPGV